jgi:hypothetical protein
MPCDLQMTPLYMVTVKPSSWGLEGVKLMLEYQLLGCIIPKNYWGSEHRYPGQPTSLRIRRVSKKEKERKIMNRCLDIQKFRVPLLATACFLQKRVSLVLTPQRFDPCMIENAMKDRIWPLLSSCPFSRHAERDIIGSLSFFLWKWKKDQSKALAECWRPLWIVWFRMK